MFSDIWQVQWNSDALARGLDAVRTLDLIAGHAPSHAPTLLWTTTWASTDFGPATTGRYD